LLLNFSQVTSFAILDPPDSRPMQCGICNG
jgi:hypothetical protein